MSLTTQNDWQSYWGHRQLHTAFQLFDDIAPYLPVKPGAAFLEIGCAPGRILASFCARFAYEAYGVDFAGDPEEMEKNLRQAGVTVGKVYQADFFEWNPGREFDVVTSFGFIEHFEDAGSVLDRHFALTKPGGVVAVTMPHFAGGQKALHWMFDRPNLARHNTEIMNLPFLRSAAERNGAKLLTAHYAGGHFNFWVEKDSASLRARRVIRKVSRGVRAVSKLLPGKSNPWFSPFLVAVYQKAK